MRPPRLLGDHHRDDGDLGRRQPYRLAGNSSVLRTAAAAGTLHRFRRFVPPRRHEVVGSYASSSSSSLLSPSHSHFGVSRSFCFRHYTPAPPTLKGDASGDPAPVSVKEAILNMKPFLWPHGRWDHRMRVVVAFSFVFLSKGALVIGPLIFKHIIDSLVTPGAAVAAGIMPITTFSLVVAYGVSRFTGAFTTEMRTAIFARVSADAYTQLHENILIKLLNMDLNYHLSRKTGSLTRVLDRGSRAFSNLSFILLFILVPTAFEMLLVCGMLHTQAGFSFVVTAVVAVATYVAFTFYITNLRNKFREQYNERETRAASMVVDSLINFETVKYFAKEREEARRLRSANEDMNQFVIKLEQSAAVLNFGQQAIFILAGVVSLYFSSTAVIAGTMTVGDLVLVDSLLLQLYVPLSMLGIVYRETLASTQNMQQMVGLLKAPVSINEPVQAAAIDWQSAEEGNPTTVPSSTSVPVVGATTAPSAASEEIGSTGIVATRDNGEASVIRPPSRPIIRFENVSFSYPKQNKKILTNVSFDITPGSCVAFVGSSGCGKSSLFRLLYRFYDVDSGIIHVAGHDIRTVAIASLRQGIAVVPQDCVLFNGTVRYNIAYGLPEQNDGGLLPASWLPPIAGEGVAAPPAASAEVDPRIIAAAKAANLHGTILGLEKQYDTEVGERGLKLSGGEKQRLAIARALLKDAPIMLCDEATSALDNHAERKVMSTLRSRGCDIGATTGHRRTVLLIAHRLTTVRNCDCIYVLEAGRIVESGTHDELLEIPGGVYVSMWVQQQQNQKQQPF